MDKKLVPPLQCDKDVGILTKYLGGCASSAVSKQKLDIQRAPVLTNRYSESIQACVFRWQSRPVGI